MPITKTIQWMSWSVVLLLAACPGGGSLSEKDGGIDADMDGGTDAGLDADVDAQATLQVGEVHKLGLLPAADFSQGFENPIIVDDAACPGQNWFPSRDNPDANDRRLRE